MIPDEGMLSRAQGCLMGQLAGDALGSYVEFRTKSDIQKAYPQGLRDLKDGGTWDTLAGQPTDDSEMALALAHSILSGDRGDSHYDPANARKAYKAWLASKPFACGGTIHKSLTDAPLLERQANGALMRVSPLGILGVQEGLEIIIENAGEDAAITHPHPICVQANQLFVAAITLAIQGKYDRNQLYSEVLKLAGQLKVDQKLGEALRSAQNQKPLVWDEPESRGWVLITFQNAFYQFLNAPNLEEGIIDTVMQGGDTDTNGAVAGALLGAFYGLKAIPRRWSDEILTCKPRVRVPGVNQPRPEIYWPVNALPIAKSLAGVKGCYFPPVTMADLPDTEGDFEVINQFADSLNGNDYCGGIEKMADWADKQEPLTIIDLRVKLFRYGRFLHWNSPILDLGPEGNQRFLEDMDKTQDEMRQMVRRIRQMVAKCQSQYLDSIPPRRKTDSFKIEVIKADITLLKVDAIVNAANPSLLGGGGVDGAIHLMAGPNLLIECRSLNGCKPGTAKITKGYQLLAPWVIHTVGPMFEGGFDNEGFVLTSCYRACMQLAAEKGVKTIAFPAISCGAYGFPINRACRIAWTAIKESALKHPGIEQVILAAWDDAVLDEYHKLQLDQSDIPGYPLEKGDREIIRETEAFIAGQICPRCGSESVAEILRGMPVWNEGMGYLMDQGKLVIGGCMVDSENDKELECHQCGENFDRE